MKPVLDIQGLSVSFRAGQDIRTVTQDISFKVEPGKIVALVGESGSGKSVTALAIMGLLPAAASISGRLLLNSGNGSTVDLLSLNHDKLRSIRGKEVGMVFQEPMTSLNPLMSCGKQVAECIRNHRNCTDREAKAEAIDWLTRVELPDPSSIYDRYPHQLSGGQKQRVMIAMAVCNKPRLLIADEPTTALDVQVQKSIMRLLENLQQENGMAVIFVTHDLGLVADYADETHVMLRGNMVESGQTKQVLQQPAHPYTKGLLACRPAGYPKNRQLPSMHDFMSEGGNPAPRPGSFVLPEPGSTAYLSVRDLAVTVRQKSHSLFTGSKTKEIIRKISFDVMEGEILGLVGESGSGKTTLGRAILGLVQPSSGSILLRNEDITTRKNARQQASTDRQVVFQDPYGSLNPRITIGEAIAEPIRVHGFAANKRDAREKTSVLLRQVNLEPGYASRYPHQFSGGQRQRICIARALSVDPAFMVFDESLSALDLSVQAQMLNLVNELRLSRHLTAVFISHDLSVVRYIADRIMVMKDGEIVETGPAEEVYNRPSHPYTRALLEAVPGKGLHSFNGHS